MCNTCGGKTWIGEPWSPDSCPDCRNVEYPKPVPSTDNPWEVK